MIKEITLDEETNTVLAYIDNKQVGECAYVTTKEEINIVHTEVDEDYQGKGIAGKLVDRVITYAEEQNKRIEIVPEPYITVVRDI